MMGADVRVDDDFELVVADGLAFKTLYVRVEGAPHVHSEVPADDLRKEAVNGCVDAQIGWARRLLHGHGVERDPAAAFRWFCLAARTGDPEALNMVGRCHELGWGVAADPREAADWFGKAAAKDHAWAEFNLASLYAQGRGVPTDEKKALTLLVRSARRGNPKAMNMIGRFREGSDVLRRRIRSAALWSRWAAERGCFRGQFHHGRFLVAAGRIGDGLHWFRTSLAHAPADFRREGLNVLGTHDHPKLRDFALKERSGEQGGSK